MPISFDPTPIALQALEGQNKSATINRALGYLVRLLEAPSPLDEEQTNLLIGLCHGSRMDFSNPMAGLIELAIHNSLGGPLDGKFQEISKIVSRMTLGERIAIHERICRK